MAPEKIAYALARYSRSPDSIVDSIEWVRTHDSAKFLESFYFQYGHASIADLGHLTLCFEGVSELAATEIEDEPLWDGQARSSRYQNFAKNGFVVPPEFTPEDTARYQEAGESLLDGYAQIHAAVFEQLKEKLPRPESMKPDAYERNLAARAFDVARYCLFMGVPTGVGQVVSIRTLERQIRRMRASEYAELRDLGAETATACAEPPLCGDSQEPLAPTLAKYVQPDAHLMASRADLVQWAAQNLGHLHLDAAETVPDVDLLKPQDTTSDLAATLLYSVTDMPYRVLYEECRYWPESRRREVIDAALQSRGAREDLLRSFRSAPYVFDIRMDLGAYRDMHRHRRCVQIRKPFGTVRGYAVPQALVDAGLEGMYRALMQSTYQTIASLPSPGSHYLLPFGAMGRFLFKMDFAEAEYICRLRSGVKGHFSYRKVAWDMAERMKAIEPELAYLVQATPPWEEDPLKR
jgi:thymidylate synthase ThyX